MHFRFLVTFNKENANNSEEARQYAYKTLSEDDSFCGEGGRFGCPMADWFVIGGRWSGALLDTKKFLDEVGKRIEVFNNDFLSTKDIEDHKVELQKIWEELGYKGQNIYNRDSYNSLGSDDDASIVNKDIYKRLLKEHEGESDDGESFADLDYDEVSGDYINKKWIVVVDYHS